MDKKYLDLDTVAEMLGISKATLLEAIDQKELAAVKGVWKGYRTCQEWVDAWLARKTINPEAATPSSER